MPITKNRSACCLAGIALGLLVSCGGGSNPPAPAPGGNINDPACQIQYTLTDAPMLAGADPQFPQQWHLHNDGTVTGRAGEDLRAPGAWTVTRGEGVRVAVIDDAIEVTHEDLAPNVVAGGSFNYRQGRRGNSWPLPCNSDDGHGTSVAGLIAARDGNAVGMAGVAPRASLVGYNALATSLDTDVSEALNRDLGLNSVYNNSWGSPDDGFLHPAEPSFVAAIRHGITHGRDGKGAIYVFPSGNGGCYNPDLQSTPAVEPCVRENSNYDGYVNKLGIIAACAVDSNGRQPFYGERGANLLVCAPSSNLPPDSSNGFTNADIRTTAIRNQYRDDFTGTSASTPMVAGVAALILAVNPELTWRDVRLIMARTARQNDSPPAGPPVPDPEWQSAFGLNFSHKYGFGVVNAEAAVQAARTWTSVGGSESLLQCGPYAQTVGLPIPDPVASSAGSTPQPVPNTIAVTDCAIGKIEFVEVRFTARNDAKTASHPSTGDLRIRLQSPQGLVSELSDAHVCYTATEETVNCGDYNDYPFGSVRHLEEPVIHAGNGNWTLEVTDMLRGDTGQFASWGITFYGRP